MTESDKSQQNGGKSDLTDRQLKAIPIIVASPTYTQGCRRAKVNRTTFYEWLKDPHFRAELDRQRDRITTSITDSPPITILRRSRQPVPTGGYIPGCRISLGPPL